MSKEHKYFVGKVSRNEDKRPPRNCDVYITWEIENGRFSMSGEIWNHLKTDVFHCGQCVDRIQELFPHNKKLRRMREIWERWHLNDLTAGSPSQEAYLRKNPVTAVYPESHYTKACEVLAAAGLNPDPNYLRDGKPYHYGSAWLREELPPEVLAEIQSWEVPHV